MYQVICRRAALFLAGGVLSCAGTLVAWSAQGQNDKTQVTIRIAERIPIDAKAPMPRQAVDEIRGDAVDEVALAVAWSDKEKAPKDGQITLVASAGQFVGTEKAVNPISVAVKDGVASAHLKGLSGHSGNLDLGITAFDGAYGGPILAQEHFRVRRPRRIWCVVEKDVVVADGVDQCRCTILTMDLAWRPIADVSVELEWSVPGPMGRGLLHRIEKITTDYAGVATFVLPATTGTGLGQIAATALPVVAVVDVEYISPET